MNTPASSRTIGRLPATSRLISGLRYEYYSPPYEANGKAAIPVNGTAGAFGISGSSYADAYRPGPAGGTLTQLKLVGPGDNVYDRDYHTLLPAVGVSWAIGKREQDRAARRLCDVFRSQLAPQRRHRSGQQPRHEQHDDIHLGGRDERLQRRRYRSPRPGRRCRLSR